MITRSRNLRTGRSIWLGRRAPRVQTSRLHRDIETDVLIIGAGITGAMIADALIVAGRDVVLVDRRGPAKGSTSASTALVQYAIDTPLVELSRKIGRRDATRAWRRSRLAVDAIAARLDELGVNGIEQRNTLYLTGTDLDAKAMAREHEARTATGLSNRLLDRRALREEFDLSRAAAILGYGDLVIDPRRATLALLHEACRHGARIYAPTDVIDLAASRSKVIATTADDHRIECRHAVFATGYELPRSVPHRGHRIASTWAIATAPQKRRLWPQQCMIWEASSPYLYVRTTPEGHVICGGEDEDISDAAKRDALLPAKTRTLQRKLGRLIPTLDIGVAFAWCGTFGASRTGLPTIGAVPAYPNCWAALGYGGNGTTYARIAADVICGAIIGNPDIDADLYDFKSKT